MKEISHEEYYNKVLGSWLGRVAGDFVGAPVELKSQKYIKRNYGNITYYPKPINLNYVNDDEMYEIVALIALEKYGINLSAKDIAQEWVSLLKNENFIFTAEKIAYNNLKSNIFPPKSGILNNFYYDFIGAQMRADIWGQITPGCPEIAKEYAEMDGSISHADIGIEGEGFIATLISQAFFEGDIRKNIKLALGYLTSEDESLYSKMIYKAMQIYEQYPKKFRKARNLLVRDYWKKHIVNKLIENSKYFPIERRIILNSLVGGIHVLPNIGIIILSLLYGSEDKEDPLGRSICIAAMMGLDTDCNCGNIGAILGAQLGAEKIPSKWKDPLQNTFSTYVEGYEKWKISDLAQRITNIGEKVLKHKAQNVVIIKKKH
ncbi:MAG: ADP-ribosylglycohydrolase family protein [Promethearchaeota archaeon]